jgi:hypothetical protein
MAASIKGVQVIWGVPAGAITGAHSVVTAGIIESFEITNGGGTTVITDEDDDPVTRIDHNAERKVALSVVCKATTILPAKGVELTGLGTIDGVNFATGRVFVDDAKAVYSQGAVKKISISATHYPIMAADA